MSNKNISHQFTGAKPALNRLKDDIQRLRRISLTNIHTSNNVNVSKFTNNAIFVDGEIKKGDYGNFSYFSNYPLVWLVGLYRQRLLQAMESFKREFHWGDKAKGVNEK